MTAPFPFNQVTTVELTYKNQTYVLGGYPVLYAKAFKGTRDICFTFTPLSLNENDAQPLNGLHYPPGVRAAFPNQYPNNPFTPRPNNAWMSNNNSTFPQYAPDGNSLNDHRGY